MQICNNKLNLQQYFQFMNSQIQFQKQEDHVSKKSYRKVLVLSFFYLLVITSYTSFSNIIIYLHQKYKHKGIGQSYLTANSIFSVITYIFCPIFLSKIKTKSSRLLAICVSTYLIVMIVPAIFSLIQQEDPLSEAPPPSTFRFSCEIIANGICGIGSGIFWVLNGIYMADYCKAEPSNKKGRYFSISNLIINSRTIIAPLLTTLGLGLGNQIIYFFIQAIIVLLALPIPLFFIPSVNLKKQQSFSNNNQSTDQQIELHKQNALTCRQIVFHFLSFLKNFKNFYLILPTCIVTGLIMGFVSSSLSHLLPKPAENQNNDTKMSIALIFFGIGSMLGGYLSGLICDKFSLKIAGYLGNFMIGVTCVTEIYFLNVEHSLKGTSIVGFLAGLSHSFLFSYIAIICTIHFKGSAESFAVTRLVNVIFYISYQWIVALLNTMCNMKFNMSYQSAAIIPFAVLAAYFIKIRCQNYQMQQQASDTVLEPVQPKNETQQQPN